MDVRFINPFIQATQHVFNMLVKLPIRIGRPAFREIDKSPVKFRTICIAIDIKGTAAGRVALRFPEAIVVRLLTAFSGGTITKLDDNAYDGLREITNIVVGNAKRRLPGGNNAMSTPTATRDGTAGFAAGERILVLPIESQIGTFWLEAQIRVNAVEYCTDNPSIESPVLNDADIDAMVNRLLAQRDGETTAYAA